MGISIPFVISLIVLTIASAFANGRFSSFLAYQVQIFTLSFSTQFFKSQSAYSLSVLASLYTGAFIGFNGVVSMPFYMFPVVVLVVSGLLYIAPHFAALSLSSRVSYPISFPVFFSVCSFFFRTLSPWSCQGLPALASSQSFYVPILSYVGIEGLSYVSVALPCVLGHICKMLKEFQQNMPKFTMSKMLLFGLSLLIFSANVFTSYDFTNYPRTIEVSGIVMPRHDVPAITSSNRAEFERRALDWAFDLSTDVAHQSKLIVWSETMVNVSITSTFNTFDELFIRARDFTKSHSVYLVTTYHLNYENGTVFNELAVFSNGELLGKYTKVNLVFLAEDHITPADSKEKPLLIDTEFGRLGLLICHDLDFPFFTSHLQSADLVIVPAWDWKGIPRNTFGSTLRAAELGIPIVRVTHAGWSAVTDHVSNHLFGASHFSRPIECPEWVSQLGSTCESGGVLQFSMPVPIGRRFVLFAYIRHLIPPFMILLLVAVLIKCLQKPVKQDEEELTTLFVSRQGSSSLFR
ncbi:hypothetical protein RCL1_006266 [Eukaryota sp. TZLM3-RCL]